MNKHPLKLGDTLYASWGYDQTNVDFYKVAELRGKTMAKIVPVAGKLVRESGSATYKVADPDAVREYDVLLGVNKSDLDKGKWKRPRENGSVRLTDYGVSAYPDDGREHYETHWAYGH